MAPGFTLSIEKTRKEEALVVETLTTLEGT